jgi:hypothetical protein
VQIGVLLKALLGVLQFALRPLQKRS